MENNWASENLQTIRTLMERSALYRRALAPIMIVAGTMGAVASTIPHFINVDTNSSFSLFWTIISGVVFLTSLFLVRRQALRDAEPFWSLPTRRVWQALLPNFFAGIMVGLLFYIRDLTPSDTVWILPPVWMLFYGCGLHAAGFFMQRSMRWFGWAFIIFGLLLLFCAVSDVRLQSIQAAHYMMGIFFGVSHLAFGIYLFFTERKKNEA